MLEFYKRRRMGEKEKHVIDWELIKKRMNDVYDRKKNLVTNK